jgi:hypothetical protein
MRESSPWYLLEIDLNGVRICSPGKQVTEGDLARAVRQGVPRHKRVSTQPFCLARGRKPFWPRMPGRTGSSGP